MIYDMTLRPDYTEIAREAKGDAKPQAQHRTIAFILQTAMLDATPRPAPARGTLDQDGKYTMTLDDYNQYRRGKTRDLYKRIRAQRATLRRNTHTIKLLSPKAAWLETIDLAEILETA